MVVTHGQCIGFYSSSDLKHWGLESTFGTDAGRHSSGPWECPDLFRMTAPNGQSLWVLVVGIGTGAFAEGSGTQYFVGQFDGRVFQNINAPQTTKWLDFGRDYYAAQSFSGVVGAPVVMAWASNWSYARKTPTAAFRGVLSLPRELRLVEDPAGICVAASVPEVAASQFECYVLGTGSIAPRSGVYRLKGVLPMSRDQPTAISLFGESEPQIVVRQTEAEEIVVTLMRGLGTVGGAFGHSYQVPISGSGEVDVDMFVDNGLVEVAFQNGTIWATNLYFPDQPGGAVRIQGGAIA